MKSGKVCSDCQIGGSKPIFENKVCSRAPDRGSREIAGRGFVFFLAANTAVDASMGKLGVGDVLANVFIAALCAGVCF
jgi:hypothetical protein